jgi:tetratricopeptide (TPR) repeat protein
MELTIDQAIQKAVELHRAGKLHDAERLYRAILEAKPQHPDANHNLGVIAVSLNQTKAALPLFKTALEANPSQGQFWLSYIDALIKEKQFDHARNFIIQGKKAGLEGERIDGLEAQLTTSLLLQSSETLSINKFQTFTQERKNASAKKKEKEKKKKITPIKKNLNQVRSPFQVKMNTFLEYYQKGHYDLAENLAKEITQKYPEHQLGWKALGTIFKQAGKLQESLIANQKAIAISPNDADAHSSLGITLQELGRLEDAETSYKKAILIKPEYAEAHFNMGNTLQKLGRLEDAETNYKRAIAIKPEFAEAHYNLGNTFKELGRLDDAETSYNKAISIKPEYAEAHSNLGNLLKELGRLEDAEASYKKAISIKRDCIEAHYNLGNTLKELGRLEEAEASYSKAISIKSEFAEAHSNLGLILQELGRLERAETSYKKAITIKPEYAEAHSNLGTTLQELGRLEEAEASYRKAISLKPDHEAAQYNLGIWYCEQGKYKQAAELLLRAKNFKNGQSYLLKCWYFLNEQSLFYELLDCLASQGTTDAIIGSFGCRAAIKFGIVKVNSFCSSPLNYVFKADLSKKYDFEGKFVKPTLSTLNDKKAQNRSQNLLINGLQTSGNLFALENILIDEMKKLIELEIENYRLYFKDSKEGLFENWPDAYSLYGWIIRMKNGGVLRPHMHEKGWISGSIYINVPPKININDGNLVVCIEDDAMLSETQDNKKNIINVTTGSLCLFPASLLHYTIPFESDEERIVLAFDVVPIKKEVL